MPETDEIEQPEEPRPAVVKLSAEVVAARAKADAEMAALSEGVDPHLAVVHENCRIALGALTAQHARVADVTDLDFDAETRWAARWRLAGAAIAYAHTLVDVSAAGHVDTAIPTSRTLHETLGVLGVVNDTAETTILTKWLGDEEIQPKKVRAAVERQAQRVATDAAEHGVEIDVSAVKELMTSMYSTLSDVSHVRRSGVRSLASVSLRRAVYGRHPDPRERVGGAASTVLAVESTIVGVGDALASFYGGTFYSAVIKPIQDGLMKQSREVLSLAETFAPTSS